MTESPWKVIVDGDHLTISSDAFTFSTTGTDPMRIEGVIADLQSALRGTYGQYCGLSRAAEMVGERWGFLIIRDLLMGPKSVTELIDGLPRMSPSLLSRRLKELEFVGVVREIDAGEDGQARYELTEYGRASEDAVLEFGRWGAAALALPRPEDIVTESSLMVALKATFLPELAGGLRATYEVHIAGCVLNVRVADGAIAIAAGPYAGADSVLHLGFAFRELLTGEVTAKAALATGQVRVDGDPELLSRFVEMFQLPKMPTPKQPGPRVPA